MKPRFTLLPVLALLPALVGCNNNTTTELTPSAPAVRPAKILPVVQTDLSPERVFPAVLEAPQESDLAFRVGGQLIELPAHAGLRVKAGDTLARLDATDYEVAVAEQAARFNLAKSQLNQNSQLLKQNLSSKSSYSKANAEFKLAQAALQQAQNRLVRTVLKAPFDGVVSRVNTENHQSIKAHVPIIEFKKLPAGDIRFSVPESLLAKLRRIEEPALLKGICGEVSFTAHPEKTYQACYKEHEVEPDSVTRNFSVLFELVSAVEFMTLPGMTASIKLDAASLQPSFKTHKLFVTVESVFNERDAQWVWLVNEDASISRTKVTVGAIDGNRIEIKNGLKPGQRVVSAGVSHLREGMRVKPMIKQRGL